MFGSLGIYYCVIVLLLIYFCVCIIYTLCVEDIMKWSLEKRHYDHYVSNHGTPKSGSVPFAGVQDVHSQETYHFIRYFHNLEVKQRITIYFDA